MSEDKNQVEALLFVSGRAMTIDEIKNISNLNKKKVKKALKQLKEDYESRDTGLAVYKEGETWKINIKEEHVSLVTNIVADTELSQTVMETLAVIAWKSPVLQSDVVKIRTSNAYDHIKELVNAGFITKEREGRTYRLKITEKFFDYFDVPGEKGIKEAFEASGVTEKASERLGKLKVVSIDEEKPQKPMIQVYGMKENSDEDIIEELDEKEESEIVVEEKNSEKKIVEDEKEDDVETEKKELPTIDRDFLDKINSEIEKISARNKELDEDELFKQKEEIKEELEGEPAEESKEESSELESDVEVQNPDADEESPDEKGKELEENSDFEVEEDKK